jgi:hypothetical protein
MCRTPQQLYVHVSAMVLHTYVCMCNNYHCIITFSLRICKMCVHIQNVCTFAKCMYICKMYVHLQNVCTFAKCMYICKMYVHMQNVCTYAKCIYICKMYVHMLNVCTYLYIWIINCSSCTCMHVWLIVPWNVLPNGRFGDRHHWNRCIRWKPVRLVISERNNNYTYTVCNTYNNNYILSESITTITYFLKALQQLHTFWKHYNNYILSESITTITWYHGQGSNERGSNVQGSNVQGSNIIKASEDRTNEDRTPQGSNPQRSNPQGSNPPGVELPRGRTTDLSKKIERQNCRRYMYIPLPETKKKKNCRKQKKNCMKSSFAFLQL